MFEASLAPFSAHVSQSRGQEKRQTTGSLGRSGLFRTNHNQMGSDAEKLQRSIPDCVATLSCVDIYGPSSDVCDGLLFFLRSCGSASLCTSSSLDPERDGAKLRTGLAISKSGCLAFTPAFLCKYEADCHG